MITYDHMISSIKSGINDVAFLYDGKQCGIGSIVNDRVPSFTVWCGTKYEDHSEFSDVLKSKIYDGQTIKEIFPKIEQASIVFY